MATTLLHTVHTVHGSRLYGTAHAQSDFDTYQVVRAGKGYQQVSGYSDTTVVSLSSYIRQINNGVPQALEALWSPYAVIAGEWAQLWVEQC